MMKRGHEKSIPGQGKINAQALQWECASSKAKGWSVGPKQGKRGKKRREERSKRQAGAYHEKRMGS